MKRRGFLSAGAAAACLPWPMKAVAATRDEALSGLAREAYVYAYPMVENYLSLYQYAIDTTSDQYNGPMNEVANVARVFTPEDTGVTTPNSDTPYSFLVMDLRAEPLVITLPEIEGARYYRSQLIDLYSHNTGYLGTRSDGNRGGHFLVAGPDWDGEVQMDATGDPDGHADTPWVCSGRNCSAREDIDRVHRDPGAVWCRAAFGLRRNRRARTGARSRLARNQPRDRPAALLGLCELPAAVRAAAALGDGISARPSRSSGWDRPPHGPYLDLDEATQGLVRGAGQTAFAEIATGLAAITTSVDLFGSQGDMRGKEDGACHPAPWAAFTAIPRPRRSTRATCPTAMARRSTPPGTTT